MVVVGVVEGVIGKVVVVAEAEIILERFMTRWISI